MYQEVLRSVEGVGIFPGISLVVFMVVFTLVVVYAARLDRAGVSHMAALPLEDQEERR
jgi:cytochrome c oxidase cbb3-type subunit IV